MGTKRSLDRIDFNRGLRGRRVIDTSSPPDRTVDDVR